MRRVQIILSGVLLAAAQQALADSHIVEIAWSRDGTFTHGTSVEPGKFWDLC